MDRNMLYIPMKFSMGGEIVPAFFQLPLGSTVGDLMDEIEKVCKVPWREQIFMFRGKWFYPHPGDDLAHLADKTREVISLLTRDDVENFPRMWNNQVRSIDDIVK